MIFSLTAIMLGRLRMTIAQAFAQYDNVGKNVFQRPKFWAHGMLRKMFVDELSGNAMDQTLKEATAKPQDHYDSKKERKRDIDWRAKITRMKDYHTDAART